MANNMKKEEIGIVSAVNMGASSQVIKTASSTFAKLMPIKDIKNLHEAEIAITNGAAVGEISKLRIALICQKVYLNGLYAKGGTYEAWAMNFKPLGVKNKQSAYDYLNVAKLLTVDENDQAVCIFKSHRGENLNFSHSQLVEIYNALKVRDGKSTSFPDASVSKVQDLIKNGIEKKSIPAKSAKIITAETLEACTKSVEEQSEVFKDFVILSPKMKVLQLREYLKVVMGKVTADKSKSKKKSNKKSAEKNEEREVGASPNIELCLTPDQFYIVRDMLKIAFGDNPNDIECDILEIFAAKAEGAQAEQDTQD